MNSAALDVEQLLDEVQSGIQALLDASDLKNPLIVGISTGGIWLAKKLQKKLNIETPPGELNIAFYRDDFSQIGIHPHVGPSSIPFDLENRHIILVDDVLHTGRTIRAAMNEIFDFGRPASIILAVLIERSGRELPIEAHVCGKSLKLKAGEHVKLHGPEPLALEIN